MSNHDLRDPDEMSVEDENRRNSETDDMHTILDNFMQAKEETLEELVGGFMYLTMEDILKASNPATVLASSNKPDVYRGEDDDMVLTASVLNRVTAPGYSSVAAEVGGREADGRQTEEIEEEILEDGMSSRHSCEDTLFRHRPASLTKFDNFMLSEDDPESDRGRVQGENENEEDGEEEENWMPTSGYMASFATGHASSEGMAERTDITDGINEAQTLQSMLSEASMPSPQHTSSQHSTSITSQANEALPSDTCCSEQTEESVSITESTELQHDAHSRVCDNDVEAPAWALNPGEAEEEIHSVPVEQRLSVIEVSTKVASSVDVADADSKAVSDNAEENCSDEVVPFELDEDYDYDSVVYTPKFTQAEMNYLTSFLPHNS